MQACPKNKNMLGQFGSGVALPQRLREAGAETSQLLLSCGVTEVYESLLSECVRAGSQNFPTQQIEAPIVVTDVIHLLSWLPCLDFLP